MKSVDETFDVMVIAEDENEAETIARHCCIGEVSQTPEELDTDQEAYESDSDFKEEIK